MTACWLAKSSREVYIELNTSQKRKHCGNCTFTRSGLGGTRTRIYQNEKEKVARARWLSTEKRRKGGGLQHRQYERLAQRTLFDLARRAAVALHEVLEQCREMGRILG